MKRRITTKEKKTGAGRNWDKLPSNVKEFFWRIEQTMVGINNDEDCGYVECLAIIQQEIVDAGFNQDAETKALTDNKLGIEGHRILQKRRAVWGY